MSVSESGTTIQARKLLPDFTSFIRATNYKIPLHHPDRLRCATSLQGVSKIVVAARFRARVLPTEANGEQPVARMSVSEIRGRLSTRKPLRISRSLSSGRPPRAGPVGTIRATKRREAERRQTQSIHWPHLRMRRASGGTRSPVGVPPRLLLRRPNATAQLRLRASWDGALTGVTRLQPVPVQRAPRRPVIVPAGRIPGAARERGYKPRPQEPHSLHRSAVAGDVPSIERDSPVNVT